jgi:hypothetical protein
MQQPKKFKYIVGIDPGRKTGLAVYNTETKLLTLDTCKLHQAFWRVAGLKQLFDIEVVIENPNLWTHFKNTAAAKAKLQGAGSVKRDYSAWTDFLEDYDIPYKAVRPDKTRNSYAYDTELFVRLTGYKKKCSEHARVAAMLVWRK